MAESESSARRPASLRIYDRSRPAVLSGVEVAALALSVLWLGGSVIFLLNGPEAPAESTADPLRTLLIAMAILLPVAMIWVVAMAIRSTRVMREETEHLQTAVDALRQAYLAQNQGGMAESAVTRKLDEFLSLTRKTEAALAALTATDRETPPPEPEAPPAQAEAPQDDQPSLALGPSMADLTPPLPSADFIRALNFPDTADDKEGFAALRRAMRDRTTGQLVQAAQDVLTLLSHEGIYMDDLSPDRARPDTWRAFAQGARGRSISSLGGIHDRTALARTGARMKQDPIFRDAAHHFLRKFDHTFAAFEPIASDAEISALSDTRTARAFMLLGRVAGTFD